jgi:hypothetical protein
MKYKGLSNVIKGYKFATLNSKDKNLHITAVLYTKTVKICKRNAFHLQEGRTQNVYTCLSRHLFECYFFTYAVQIALPSDF